MTSVADQLRRDTTERVRRMSAADRVDLALTLGENDLRLFMLASRKPRHEALKELRRRRARGRTVSRAGQE